MVWAATRLDNWHARGECLAILFRGRPDDSAVGELARAAVRNHPHEHIVGLAACHLLSSGGQDIVVVLERAMSAASDDAPVYRVLADSLRDAAGEPAVRSAVHAGTLRAAPPPRRLAAALLLITVDPSATTSDVVLSIVGEAWGDAGTTLRRRWLGALAKHRATDVALRPLLFHAARDPDAAVRAAAWRLLTSVPGSTPADLPDIDGGDLQGSGWSSGDRPPLRGAAGGGGAGSGGS